MSRKRQQKQRVGLNFEQNNMRKDSSVKKRYLPPIQIVTIAKQFSPQIAKLRRKLESQGISYHEQNHLQTTIRGIIEKSKEQSNQITMVVFDNSNDIFPFPKMPKNIHLYAYPKRQKSRVQSLTNPEEVVLQYYNLYQLKPQNNKKRDQDDSDKRIPVVPDNFKKDRKQKITIRSVHKSPDLKFNKRFDKYFYNNSQTLKSSQHRKYLQFTKFLKQIKDIKDYQNPLDISSEAKKGKTINLLVFTSEEALNKEFQFLRKQPNIYFAVFGVNRSRYIMQQNVLIATSDFEQLIGYVKSVDSNNNILKAHKSLQKQIASAQKIKQAKKREEVPQFIQDKKIQEYYGSSIKGKKFGGKQKQIGRQIEQKRKRMQIERQIEQKRKRAQIERQAQQKRKMKQIQRQVQQKRKRQQIERQIEQKRKIKQPIEFVNDQSSEEVRRKQIRDNSNIGSKTDEINKIKTEKSLYSQKESEQKIKNLNLKQMNNQKANNKQKIKQIVIISPPSAPGPSSLNLVYESKQNNKRHKQMQIIKQVNINQNQNINEQREEDKLYSNSNGNNRSHRNDQIVQKDDSILPNILQARPSQQTDYNSKTLIQDQRVYSYQRSRQRVSSNQINRQQYIKQKKIRQIRQSSLQLSQGFVKVQKQYYQGGQINKQLIQKYGQRKIESKVKPQHMELISQTRKQQYSYARDSGLATSRHETHSQVKYEPTNSLANNPDYKKIGQNTYIRIKDYDKISTPASPYHEKTITYQQQYQTGPSVLPLNSSGHINHNSQKYINATYRTGESKYRYHYLIWNSKNNQINNKKIIQRQENIQSIVRNQIANQSDLIQIYEDDHQLREKIRNAQRRISSDSRTRIGLVFFSGRSFDQSTLKDADKQNIYFLVKVNDKQGIQFLNNKIINVPQINRNIIKQLKEKVEQQIVRRMNRGSNQLLNSRSQHTITYQEQKTDGLASSRKDSNQRNSTIYGPPIRYVSRDHYQSNRIAEKIRSPSHIESQPFLLQKQNPKKRRLFKLKDSRNSSRSGDNSLSQQASIQKKINELKHSQYRKYEQTNRNGQQYYPKNHPHTTEDFPARQRQRDHAMQQQKYRKGSSPVIGKGNFYSPYKLKVNQEKFENKNKLGSINNEQQLLNVTVFFNTNEILHSKKLKKDYGDRLNIIFYSSLQEAESKAFNTNKNSRNILILEPEHSGYRINKQLFSTVCMNGSEVANVGIFNISDYKALQHLIKQQVNKK